MPPKKRINLGRKTRPAQYQTRARNSESPSQREERRNVERIRQRNVCRAQEREHSTLRWDRKEGSAFNYDPRLQYAAESDIGAMHIVCGYCNALKWKEESQGLCCSSGKVRLDFIQPPPEPLKSLLNGDHPLSKEFLRSIRAYNSAFQFTSFGANEISEGNFMPTFKIQGQIYHLIGSLQPAHGDTPKFLQIYFIADYLQQAQTRLSHISNINGTIVTELQRILHDVNPYVQEFKSALEFASSSNVDDYNIVIHADRKASESEHTGRYNAPTTNEVAVVMVNQECDKRDIILHARGDTKHRISETNRAYDALQYPLMFCRGEDGYHFGHKNINPQTGNQTNQKTTALQFYSYRLMVRHNEYNHLIYFQQLFNQFIVDMYAKIETERLLFFRTNQTKLRAESYIHLRDALRQDESTENLGQLVILPSSFTGGPRYMHERTQDAFCYVRKYSRPDLFITFTTNPKWEEISRELLAGQLPYNRHDIVSRVFHLKLKKLMGLLTKAKIFGSVRCYMYSVEWQKRGLPHAHILLWLVEKVRPNQVDNIISAELPDPNEDPELYSIVKTHMVHGPCGLLNLQSPCMKDRCCSKKYPRAFVSNTITGEDGYPTYRRRSPEEGGFTTEIRLQRETVQIDNKWIVPYSPVLLRTFSTHINVELCSSVQSIKYICKYVNKGSDLATVGIHNQQDELLKYQMGRYISTSEAIWRILAFHIHERFPPVMHLDVHLKNGQRIYFDADNLQERIENPRNTTLMAFFNLCQTDDFAKTLLYEEVAAYYTYNKKAGKFERRRCGTPLDGHTGILHQHVLGRVYTVHPNNHECFYLRLLLYNVRGPTSFESLRTVNHVLHPTYQAACQALGLLESDTHWHDVLAEASVSDSPSRLRELFSIMLVFCNISNPAELWYKYKDTFSEDLTRDISLRMPNVSVDAHRDDIENRCLLMLQDVVTSIGGNPIEQYGLPAPHYVVQNFSREYLSETSYDREELHLYVQQNEPQLTNEQRTTYDKILDSVNSGSGDVFFLDAPGGTGKTFLIKLILSKIRSDGKIALAVASSGIAATLLPGGKTAHSMFKIPIDLDYTEFPVCSISKNSDRAKVIRDSVLIVWDECTMANKKSIEALDRTLQDLRSNNRLMGGVTFVFSGDFRQTLPVITRGTRADEVNACIKRSRVWHSVKQLSLTTNMRVTLGGGGDTSDREFPTILLKLGEGTIPEVNGEISLSTSLCQIVSTLEDLIENIYGHIEAIATQDDSWLCERVILAPKNEQVHSINSYMLERFPGDKVVYSSINTVINLEDAVHYPSEFLNNLSASGLPAHLITLKVGVPIMLMRNLNPPKLCNGTRLKVKLLNRNIIEATILTGSGKGEDVFIPRIPLVPSNFPFQFKRLQFPVSVCFAMTINKSQGQTLRKAGVDLRTGCFSHGQLYVACSRVRSSRDIFICPQGNSDRTTNIVYKEALQ